jgi:hypothetical protein
MMRNESVPPRKEALRRDRAMSTAANASNGQRSYPSCNDSSTNAGRLISAALRRRGLASSRLGIVDSLRTAGSNFCSGPSTFSMSDADIRRERKRLVETFDWTAAEVAEVLAVHVPSPRMP